MKILPALFLFLIFVLSCQAQANDAALAERYIRAYPDVFVTFKDGYLITKDGSKILFDDHRPKDLDRMVEDHG
ncbi:hypothetical protein EG829_21145, partial [bacterium]|nr:hypothetical protein [bacterium]